MITLKNKKVTVFGLAKSGVALAERLAQMGAQVFVTEELPDSRMDPAVLARLKELQVEVEFGGHSDRAIFEAQLVVLSPGVRMDLLIVEEARRRGIPVISEVELAALFISKPMIAVTGTNGKTTTTTLIGLLLKEQGYRVAVAGNIGFPLISVYDHDLDYVVVEVSSYQLEGIVNFYPHISVLLNITPDHLERHKTLRAYALTKANLFKNQKSRDYLVYNADSPPVRKIIPDPGAVTLLPFSRKKKLVAGTFVKRGKLVAALKGKEEIIMHKKDIFIKGEHNLENCLAAALVAKVCGVTADTIARVLKDFKGVEHRIEYVTTIKGISFYNDSKGTNPDSTLVALKALAPGSREAKRSLVLIAGGRDKGVDLSKMIKEVQQRVKAVVLIGEARERFRDEMIRAGYSDIFLEGSMEEAVGRAFKIATEGAAVLLSPACASFDMFNNYEERGRVFKQIVLDLEKRQS